VETYVKRYPDATSVNVQLVRIITVASVIHFRSILINHTNRPEQIKKVIFSLWKTLKL